MLLAASVVACSSSDPPVPPQPSVTPPAPTTPPVVEGPVPTYHQDVAPLLSRHCSGCHVAGGIGPFTLASFADAFAHRDEIAAAVGARDMPPWLPNDACGSFKDSRRLAQEDVDAIVRWATKGAPEGAPTGAALPGPPTARKLEWVDRAPDIGVDYVPQFQDEWRCFLLDPAITEDAMLVGWDLEPTLRSQVHHAGFLDTDMAEAQAKDAETAAPGWPCDGNVVVSTGRLLGSWAAGFGAVTLPQGSGIKLPAGRGIVVQIHYHMHDPSKPAADRTRVSLQLARGSLAKEASITSLGPTVGTIPPKTIGYKRTASLSLPTGGTIWALQPHMHLLVATITVKTRSGIDPDATCLLEIPKWNYHWETMHFLESGRVVPAGTVVDLECTWDNPTPKPVTDGHTLEDEMCDVALVVTH